MLDSAIEGVLPDLETIRIAIKLTTATASGSFSYFSAEQHQANREPSEDDVLGKFLEIRFLNHIQFITGQKFLSIFFSL